MYEGDIASVLITEQQIKDKIAELAEKVAADYPAQDRASDLVLVGVLKGAVMFMTDFARALPIPTQLEFMAVSSYGSSTSSSGVVRILMDLDRDISGRDVLIVEDIVDSGLTLSWLLKIWPAGTRRRFRCARCCASEKPCRWTCRSSTSASTSPTSSWWATASTTQSDTGTCRISALSTPAFTPRDQRASDASPPRKREPDLRGRRPTNGAVALV